MGLVIKSTNGTDELIIDPTSKAARVTLYSSNGTLLSVEPSGVYSLPINMGRLDGTAASGDSIWALYNNGAKLVKISAITLNTGFDGTGAATSAMYNLIRFTTTAMTGGTAVTVAKNKTSYGSSSVGDARQIAIGALGVVNVVFVSPLGAISNPRQVSSTQSFSYKSTLQYFDNIELAVGEGIAIRLGVASVAGDVISGMITWMEV